MIEKILPTMTIGDLKGIPELREIADLWVIDYPPLGDDIPFTELEKIERYDAESIVQGAQRLLDIARQGKPLNLPFYNQAELEECPDRCSTALTWFPGEPGAPYVVLCSGGGYVLLTNISEGFPTAAQFNKYGYHVFVLTYRRNGTPLIPKPQEDLAAAIRYIEAHAQELQVKPGCYVVGGFSAGGHLAASWGTQDLGSRKYGLPAPEALFLCYPGSSLVAVATSDNELVRRYVSSIAGPNYTKEDIWQCSIENQVDATYPPTYLWQTMEDPEVSFETSVLLDAALEQAGVRHKLWAVPHGDHGLGLALHSEAEGWVEQAIAFWKGEQM